LTITNRPATDYDKRNNAKNGIRICKQLANKTRSLLSARSAWFSLSRSMVWEH